MSSTNIVSSVKIRTQKGRTDRFWVPRDFDDLGTPVQVDKTLARLASQGHLLKVRRGIYWRGRRTRFGMSRPSPDDLIALVAGRRGVGPAGLSAANDLGFTTQVPAVDIVAVPRRAPRPLDAIRFVDRSSRTGRLAANLNQTEVAFLEVLNDWDRLVELSDTAASRRAVDLVSSGSVRSDRLAKAAGDEPPAVRDRLRYFLSAAGANDAADRVVPSRAREPLLAVSA